MIYHYNNEIEMQREIAGRRSLKDDSKIDYTE